MSDIRLTIPPEFDTASQEAGIAFVQELWDRIAADERQIPVPNGHRHVLDERLDAYRANPGAGRPWNEVRDELRRKLRDG